MMEEDTTFNGWKNYETWNVTVWIGNDYGLYCSMLDYTERVDDPTYREFVEYLGVGDETTPDGVAWLDEELDYDELDSFIKEAAA
jgi:hypothetical protein